MSVFVVGFNRLLWSKLYDWLSRNTGSVEKELSMQPTASILTAEQSPNFPAARRRRANGPRGSLARNRAGEVVALLGRSGSVKARCYASWPD